MSQIKRLLWPNISAYASILDSDPKNNPDPSREVNNSSTHHERFRLLGIGVFLLAALFLSAASGIWVFVGSHGDANSAELPPLDFCGNSTSEALSRGCSFDYMMWSWYPPHCPHYTDNLFRAAESFPYYKTLQDTEPIESRDLFTVIENQGSVWAVKGEHLTHCVYMLLAQGQIIRDGTGFAPILVEYEHLEHCAEFLLESVRKDDEWLHKNALTPRPRYNQLCVEPK